MRWCTHYEFPTVKTKPFAISLDFLRIHFSIKHMQQMHTIAEKQWWKVDITCRDIFQRISFWMYFFEILLLFELTSPKRFQLTCRCQRTWTNTKSSLKNPSRNQVISSESVITITEYNTNAIQCEIIKKIPRKIKPKKQFQYHRKLVG